MAHSPAPRPLLWLANHRPAYPPRAAGQLTCCVQGQVAGALFSTASPTRDVILHSQRSSPFWFCSVWVEKGPEESTHQDPFLSNPDLLHMGPLKSKPKWHELFVINTLFIYDQIILLPFFHKVFGYNFWATPCSQDAIHFRHIYGALAGLYPEMLLLHVLDLVFTLCAKFCDWKICDASCCICEYSHWLILTKRRRLWRKVLKMKKTAHVAQTMADVAITGQRSRWRPGTCLRSPNIWLLESLRRANVKLLII